MHGIFLLEATSELEKPLITVTVAERGELIKNSVSPGNQYMELTNGTRYKGIPGELAYEVIEFDRYGGLMRLSQDGIRKVSAVDSKSTRELLISQEAEDIAGLQWRFSLPLATLITALIAQSMSRTNPRKGRYLSMLPALQLCTLYSSFKRSKSRVENDKLFFSGEIWVVHIIFFSWR